MKNYLTSPATMSDSLIEELLSTPDHAMKTKREQYLFQQTIYSLMRLAQSEQMLRIRQSVDHLVPASFRLPATKSSKRKRHSKSPCPGQSWLAFGK